MKVLRILTLASIPGLLMGAAWQRHVVNRNQFDSAEPHPLSYFTEYPLLLELDPCEGCTAEKRRAQAESMGFSADVQFVGTLEKFAIYDVFYHVDTDRYRWKSILVQVGQNEYPEIYRTESFGPAGGSPLSAKIVTFGKERLLYTRCWEGPRSYEDDYWFFDKAGPSIVDFRPILAAARSVLPKDRKLYFFDGESLPGTHYLWDLDQPTLSSSLWVLAGGEQYCCSGGKIDVAFKFDHGRVIVTRTRFDPNARIKMGSGR
jgi:hypothetical protein